MATVYEAAGREGLIDLPLIQLLPGSRAAGPARTVLCGQDDNLMVHAAIERIQPGEVLVLAMPEPRPIALIGELLATQVKVRGAAAILVDAAVRDVEELARARPAHLDALRPGGGREQDRDRRAGYAGHGRSGRAIAPGDIVVLDADGAVSIPLARVAEVLAAARPAVAREVRLREKLLAGATSYDLHGLRAYVEMNRRTQDAC